MIFPKTGPTLMVNDKDDNRPTNTKYTIAIDAQKGKGTGGLPSATPIA